MLKYNDKEGINIKTRRIVYVLAAISVIAFGAWLLQDASDDRIPQKDDIGQDVLSNESEQLKEEYPSVKEPQENNNFQPREEFELKSENEYVQLRLSVTSADGKKEEVEEYLKDNLDVDKVEDYSGNTVLSSPKEEYDLALSTIIDCPHTENVLYKNEDYYPVACEIYDKSSEDGKIPEDAAQYIENIEEMCKNVIIVIN